MKGHCHEIFQPYFFMILTHVGLLFVSNRIFEYGFDFTEIFETKVRKFFCVTATKDQARQMLMNRIFMSSLSYGNLCIHAALEHFVLLDAYFPVYTRRVQSNTARTSSSLQAVPLPPLSQTQSSGCRRSANSRNFASVT